MKEQRVTTRPSGDEIREGHRGRGAGTNLEPVASEQHFVLGHDLAPRRSSEHDVPTAGARENLGVHLRIFESERQHLPKPPPDHFALLRATARQLRGRDDCDANRGIRQGQGERTAAGCDSRLRRGEGRRQCSRLGDVRGHGGCRHDAGLEFLREERDELRRRARAADSRQHEPILIDRHGEGRLRRREHPVELWKMPSQAAQFHFAPSVDERDLVDLAQRRLPGEQLVDR